LLDREFNYLSVRPDSSTGSELKAVEEACREASRTVEGLRVNCDTVSNRAKKNPRADSRRAGI
jgi:hypothetical protein